MILIARILILKEIRTFSMQITLNILKGGYQVSLSIDEQYDKIYKYCYFKVKDETLAEDLTQETFLKYFSQDRYVERGKKLAYLYTIARNCCNDALSKKVEEEYEDYPIKAENIELQLTLKQAMQTLPLLDQELLLLRVVNELKIGEISTITQLSRFAIYRRINHALAQLKQILRKEDFYE